MRTSPWFPTESAVTVALAILLVVGGGTGIARAGEYFQIGRSMASELLVSRTQSRILRTDDEADRVCDRRHFVDARVVKEPETIINGSSIPERKWQEYWRLDRCGTEIGYYVFFTVVGDGGAYFSILSTE